MDWITKIENTRHWHFMPEPQQQAAVKSYLMTPPGISISKNWRLFLARLFGVGKMEPGYPDLKTMAH